MAGLSKVENFHFRRDEAFPAVQTSSVWHQKTWWLLRMQVLVYKEVLPSSVTKWCVLRCICSFKHVFMFLQLESCVHGPC